MYVSILTIYYTFVTDPRSTFVSKPLFYLELKPYFISLPADPAYRLPDEAVSGDPGALRDAAGTQLRGCHALARAAPPHTAAAPLALTGE